MDTGVTRGHNHTMLVGFGSSRASDDFGPGSSARATERPLSIEAGGKTGYIHIFSDLLP